jgi:hypothetical protein
MGQNDEAAVGTAQANHALSSTETDEEDLRMRPIGAATETIPGEFGMWLYLGMACVLMLFAMAIQREHELAWTFLVLFAGLAFARLAYVQCRIVERMDRAEALSLLGGFVQCHRCGANVKLSYELGYTRKPSLSCRCLDTFDGTSGCSELWQVAPAALDSALWTARKRVTPQ